MGAELGTTTDPRALVPGFPDAVRATAAAMRAYGDNLHEAGSGLRRIETSEGWEGEAAEQFRSAFDGEPTKWLEAGDCFHQAAEALERHSETLTWAQGQAQEAIVLWDAGEAATNYAKKQHDRAVTQAQQQVPPGSGPIEVPFNDPGEAKRQQAREILDRARNQLATEGEQAADVVGRARDKAPERSWLEQAGDAVGQAAGIAINAVGSLGNAALNHPEMVLGVVGGAALTAVSAAGETVGVALDATGVGAIAGGPLNVVSAAGIVTGVGIAGTAAMALGAEAAGDDAVEVVDTDEAVEVEESTQDKDSLSPSDRRSVESHERLIKEHEEKLEAYKRDPEAFDNKGILKNAPNDEVRQRIIDGRVRHLEKEIQTFRDNIDKIYKGAQ
ncbi:WXG100 family type VII secretion target [Saccharopolyspora hattusasensis]|uniref:WXG100 family type VII secretion target n=1 Tax=Saccharopolyspora hattusasensis TaxID=1128679 RepID=UPI003D96E7F8